MPICSICARQSSGSVPASGLKNDQKIIQKAIAVTVALGGIFLLLASYQVLPNSVNAVSQLGGWGECFGFLALLGGTVAFCSMCKRSKDTAKEALVQRLAKAYPDINITKPPKIFTE